MRNSVLLAWSMVAIVAMVIVLQVSVDGPVLAAAAPKVASAQPESAVSVPPVVVAKAETAASYLLKMEQEYWPELQRKAAAGDAEAQWQFGFTEMRGTFGEPDVEAGIRWMEKAAAQKHGRALNSLGEVYTTGEMVPQDYPKAISYFQSAWAAGEPMGILNLGILSEYGEGRKKDNAEAVRCYRLAADKGSAAALTRLGAMYSEGDILPKDLKQAVACYRAGAEKGSADAWHNLSVMHRSGIHVPLDKEAALACAEKAWAAGGADGALMAADLLVELRQDYPRAMAYLTVYMARNRSPEAGEEGMQRLKSWDSELKTEADNLKFRELLDALFLAEWRRRSKEIFGR
jgi:TPR repeat protein